MNRLLSGRQGQTWSVPFLSVGLTAVLLAAILIGLVAGVKGLGWRQAGELLSLDTSNLLVYKVWYVRLPRVLLAIIVGSGLAIAGCLLQGITRNPLSDPEIMGINQGASFFVVLSLVMFGMKDVTATILIAGFIGAAAGGSIVYSLSRLAGYTVMRLVLAGVAVSMFMASLTTGFIILFDDKLSEILYWMAGKLSGATWTDVSLSLVSFVPAAIGSMLLANQFNIFSLGEDAAHGLGQNVVRVRRIAFLIVIVLVGGSVALTGPIGFVGLIVPHIVRSWVGTDYRIVIPISALTGATLLLVSDIGSQWVLYPTDTPVGILTALLGTPFFLYLMRRRMGGG
ncbi:FecCD family ABC transporter permease [Paenibacillus radicis (ex Xue et al. 2023)]|uniref:Iron ABC transporter permease n=1 Tax=Paenibacillus radicis (ex Xue et al. 2023) TaxID=2972489 RepID=A0ABT1YRM4_9BACL|nr:iron ABC transporter permease [Paenibacillus radicis (ex Xue et al. 2023)]MCR8635811.1 iron ABC transporter permease [Paenibacillus radicis (ex Xue et al. 2023)]